MVAVSISACTVRNPKEHSVVNFCKPKWQRLAVSEAVRTHGTGVVEAASGKALLSSAFPLTPRKDRPLGETGRKAMKTKVKKN